MIYYTKLMTINFSVLSLVNIRKYKNIALYTKENLS